MRVTLPGLFDLQVNGFAGVDFNSVRLTSERLIEALERMRATGVTRCLPTLITSSSERFAHCARVIARTAHPAIAGIHVEGPYISPQDGARGAHPREHVTAADIDDFRKRQDAAAGRIALVTLAPEVAGASRLIEYLVSCGVRVAIGHTAASPAQIAEAIAAGATLATHLGNGCAQLLPRHPNMIWELLAADQIAASFIVDGHHLPPSTVKAMIRAKGAARSILVTDAMAAAGVDDRQRTPDDGRRTTDDARRTTDDGTRPRFTIGDVVGELAPDGRVSLPGTPYLAGSSLTLDRAIGNTVRFAGVTLDEAAAMASTIPATFMGMRASGTLTADWDDDALALRICAVAP